MDDYRYTSVRDHGLPLVRAAVEGMLASQKLDAIVYPTASRRPGLIADPGVSAAATPAALLGAMGLGATNIANLTGFPDLIVPAGFTGDRLPVAISFSRPRVQRAEAAGARLQLRAGDPRAPAAAIHTASCRRDDQHAVIAFSKHLDHGRRLVDLTGIELSPMPFKRPQT